MEIKVGAKGEGTIRGSAPLDPWPGQHGTMYPFLYTIEVEGGTQFAAKANHKKPQPRFGDGDAVSFSITGMRDGDFEAKLDKAGFSGGLSGGGNAYSAPAPKQAPAAAPKVTWNDLFHRYGELVPFVKAQLVGAGLEADAAAVNAGVATIMIQAANLRIPFEVANDPF